MKPEAIRSQFDIEVKTNFNTPTLRQLERANTVEFMQAVLELSAALQADPTLSEMMPPDKFIKDMAFKFNIDLD